jgi:alpha-1,2-mannosyltransferase
MMVSLDFQMTELPRLLNATGLLPIYPPATREEEKSPIDLSPLKGFNLTVCLGKEWHRFTGHFLIPNGIKVNFVKSEFDGILPRHFEDSEVEYEGHDPLHSLSKNWWLRPQTTYVPEDLNDLNKEDPSHYVGLPSYSLITQDQILTDFTGPCIFVRLSHRP